MSKQHRTKLIKQLEEQMEATKNPQLKLDLAKQITKLMPRPRQRGTPKPKEGTSSGTSPIVAKWADRLSHVQPEAKRIEASLFCEVEERRKKPGFTNIQDVIAEVVRLLSEQERAALEQGMGVVN